MFKKIFIAIITTGIVCSLLAKEDEQVPPPLMLKKARDIELKDLATYQLKRRFIPITEDGAESFKKGIEKREKMINSSVREPMQQNRTLVINPSMVSGKPTIYASANYLTTIVFIDKYGAPWDIKDIGIGAGSFFDYKTVNPYTIWLFPKKKYKKSNLSILLKGLLTPIVFNLEENPEKVDYTVQAKILKTGSNTKINEFSYNPLQPEQRIDSNLIKKDSSIASMSDGITTAETERLIVNINGGESSDIMAWQYGNYYYVRLKGKIISPEPEPAGNPSVDGFQLYKIQAISSIFIERGGLLITATILKNKY